MTDPRMTPTNDAPVTVEPDWLNADVCIENMQIAYDDATEDADDTPVDTVVSAGDLGVLIGLAQYAVRHRLAALASAPAGDGVEDDAALLADANGWYSQAQVDDMERDSRGCLACKCGDYPRPSGNYVMPDDGWRSMWCQGCMEHVVGWCASEAEAIQKWNAQRSTELTTPPAAALARPRAAAGERANTRRLALEDADALERIAEDADDNGWQDWAATMRQAAKRFRLALQSPPAKVEGQA